MLTFRLPLPPSLNNMFATYKGRRIISREYKAWKADAAPKVMEQWDEQDRRLPDKHYALHYRVNINHQSDIGNREKAATDLLVATIPGFPGDQWCDQISIVRDRGVDGAVVDVVQLYGDRAPEPTIKAISEATAGHFGLEPIDIIAACRHRSTAHARQLAMLIAARFTSKAYTDIGRHMGGRDHSTIIHGVHEAEKRVTSDPVWAGHYAAIRGALGL